MYMPVFFAEESVAKVVAVLQTESLDEELIAEIKELVD